MRRLEAISRSPVYSHLGETLNGVTTIKAYKAEERFIQMNEDRIDNNNRYFIPILCSNR
jgi:ABC-type multidrug transport system fused ATPase/permease subunit